MAHPHLPRAWAVPWLGRAKRSPPGRFGAPHRGGGRAAGAREGVRQKESRPPEEAGACPRYRARERTRPGRRTTMWPGRDLGSASAQKSRNSPTTADGLLLTGRRRTMPPGFPTTPTRGKSWLRVTMMRSSFTARAQSTRSDDPTSGERRTIRVSWPADSRIRPISTGTFSSTRKRNNALPFDALGRESKRGPHVPFVDLVRAADILDAAAIGQAAHYHGDRDTRSFDDRSATKDLRVDGDVMSPVGCRNSAGR